MIETYQFRLYPTDEQRVLLEKHFGCCRWIYNWALEFNQKLYASEQKYKNSYSLACDGEIVKIKNENPWLKEVNSQSLVASIGHLDRSIQQLF